MVTSIDNVDKNIRKTYNFPPQNHPIHLFVDNADRHAGKKKSRKNM